MTFQKMLRTQLIVAGFGAALMLASSAKAQEITNTEFSDGPYVAAFAQPVVAQTAPASTPVMTEPQAMQAIASITAPVFTDEETLVAASSVERWIVAGMLLVAFIVIGFYCLAELNALTELKRANRSLRARTSTRMSPRTV